MIIKKKRPVIELILTLLFFSASIYYIHKKDFRSEVQLTIAAKISQPDNWKLLIDKERPLVAAVSPAADFTAVNFQLPCTKFGHARFVPGWKKGIAAIKYIKAAGLFDSHTWDSTALKTIFDNRQGIKRTFVRKDYFYIKTMGNESFLQFNQEACRTIDRISGNKTIFYFPAIALGLFFFYFVHFFAPRGLAFFFKPG
ncbi:MAG: hypothetical protein L0Y73_05850, partial [Candidatus Aminicenantes bacterium]|nr:hypothetical protein [Candidatus Aminicenantes bacterium]